MDRKRLYLSKYYFLSRKPKDIFLVIAAPAASGIFAVSLHLKKYLYFPDHMSTAIFEGNGFDKNLFSFSAWSWRFINIKAVSSWPGWKYEQN